VTSLYGLGRDTPQPSTHPAPCDLLPSLGVALGLMGALSPHRTRISPRNSTHVHNAPFSLSSRRAYARSLKCIFRANRFSHGEFGWALQLTGLRNQQLPIAVECRVEAGPETFLSTGVGVQISIFDGPTGMIQTRNAMILLRRAVDTHCPSSCGSFAEDCKEFLTGRAGAP
jgi:hypothetical protein